MSTQWDNGCDCGPGFVTRPDRPHTFWSHEMTTCGTCERPIEGRVVIRDGAVHNLAFCSDCGQSEKLVSPNADAWVVDFVKRGTPVDGERAVFKQTSSTCPGCLKLLLVDVVIRDGKVWFEKTCASCGPSTALVSEDAEYYVQAYTYARAGTEPFQFAAKVEEGCPTDCGTCDDHEQHTCLPIVEITDYCNLECPICIVNNEYAHHMTPEQFRDIVDRLVANEGFCESIGLCGGEPTSHPDFWELVEIATRPEVGRVVIITNGIRLGRDREFAEELKRRGVYIGLQYDGFSPEVHAAVRGRDLMEEKRLAIEAITELGLPTQLIFVAVKGINDHQIGQAVDLLLSSEHFLSLMFQPVAFSGFGGGTFEHNPLDRVTIPGVIRHLDEQTRGFLRKSDFAPLPCSHPQCTSLTYILRLNDGSWVPFPRFVDFRQHGGLLRSSATLVASAEIEQELLDVVHEVFANQDEIDRGPEVLAALRRCVDQMFPTDRALTTSEAMRIGEGQAKSVFIHHYMDRHDFDLERLRKCCHHYPQVDGRLMPACGFNMFHRGAAKGPETTTPSWGKGPWTTDAPRRIAIGDAQTRRALAGIHPDE